jgi:putative NIF3 family GTP cyclohydrolase 1 type 2
MQLHLVSITGWQILLPGTSLHRKAAFTTRPLFRIYTDSSRGTEVPIFHTREVITPVKDPPEGFETAGYGRIVQFSASQRLGNIVNRVMTNLQLNAVSVAIPQHLSMNSSGYEHQIWSVGICAGSGGSMLNGLDVDLLFTGELSHHEALAAVENGKCVVTVFHSNSERRYLAAGMKPALQEQVAVEIEKMAVGGTWLKGHTSEFEILVSAIDRDPFEIVTQQVI